MPAKVRLQAQIYRYLKNHKDIIHVANSVYTAKRLGKIGVETDYVIYPPVKAELYQSMLNKEKTNSVSLVSRLSKGKGLEEFIKTAERLQDIEFHLICFAVPSALPLAKRLRAEAPRNLHLHVNIDWKRRLKIMGTAKVFLSLGRKEHFGYSVCEATLAGCTPIVYPEGGVLEILEGLPHLTATNLEEAEEKIAEALETWSAGTAKIRSRIVADRFGHEAFPCKVCYYGVTAYKEQFLGLLSEIGNRLMKSLV